MGKRFTLATGLFLATLGSFGSTAPVEASVRTRAASWVFAAFGTQIGATGIEAVEHNGRLELYMGASSEKFAGPDDYWYAVAYDPDHARYEHVYVSDWVPGGIRRLKIADVLGDPTPEIVLFLYSGEIRIHDLDTKALIAAFDTPVSEIFSRGLGVADLDGDGTAEIVVSKEGQDGLYVYASDGTLLWSLSGVGGRDLVIAQMDDDPALEIATSDGQIVDGVTHDVEWIFPHDDVRCLEADDIDGDGIAELVASERVFSVSAFDVDARTTKWTISTETDIGAIHIADFDHDGTKELLLGDGSFRGIHAYDTETTQEEWYRANPQTGVTSILVADADDDGDDEVIWGGGSGSTGPDYLYVVDRASGNIEWQNVHLTGGFHGPVIGDVDGDGADEIVIVSDQSESGYFNGRIVVLDAATHQLRAVSDYVNYGGDNVNDVELGDIDGDGDLEILVATRYTGDGSLRIFDFHSDNTFELLWYGATQTPDLNAYAVEFRDVDQDGVLDIVAGGYANDTAPPRVFVYDPAATTVKLASPFLGGDYDQIVALEIDDVDHDGQDEVVAVLSGLAAYVLDAATLEIESTIPGNFTSLRIRAATGRIELGDDYGAISSYLWDGAGYAFLGKQVYSQLPIQGFDRLKSDLTAVGSNGVLQVLKGRRLLWKSACYGSTIGEHTVKSSTGELVTVSGYAVLGFEE